MDQCDVNKCKHILSHGSRLSWYFVGIHGVWTFSGQWSSHDSEFWEKIWISFPGSFDPQCFLKMSVICLRKCFKSHAPPSFFNIVGILPFVLNLNEVIALSNQSSFEILKEVIAVQKWAGTVSIIPVSDIVENDNLLYQILYLNQSEIVRTLHLEDLLYRFTNSLLGLVRGVEKADLSASFSTKL